MAYVPAQNRYDLMLYNRCGRSGLKLPAISLGLWHNFGVGRPLECNARDLPHARSISASRISISPTITGRRSAPRRRLRRHPARATFARIATKS